MLLVAAAVAYADVALDVHVTFTKEESVREINKQIIVPENSSVELHRCERGQLIGFITDVTETGAQLNLQVNECTGEECTLLHSPVLNLAWNEKATVSFGKKNEDLVVENLTIEVIAQRVETEQK
jgi:hypothetical protein